MPEKKCTGTNSCTFAKCTGLKLTLRIHADLGVYLDPVHFSSAHDHLVLLKWEALSVRLRATRTLV